MGFLRCRGAVRVLRVLHLGIPAEVERAVILLRVDSIRKVRPPVVSGLHDHAGRVVHDIAFHLGDQRVLKGKVGRLDLLVHRPGARRINISRGIVLKIITRVGNFHLRHGREAGHVLRVRAGVGPVGSCVKADVLRADRQLFSRFLRCNCHAYSFLSASIMTR